MTTARELPDWKPPVMSEALLEWCRSQCQLITDAANKMLPRPSELLLPSRLMADAEDYMKQLGSPTPPSGFTAFGIPVRVVAED